MRIAFVVPNALPLFASTKQRKIGGLETFAWNLARGLAKEGSEDVFFLVRSKWRRPPEVFENVLVGCFHEPLRDVRRTVSESIEFIPGKRIPRIKNPSLSLIGKIGLLALRKLFSRSYDEQLSIDSALDNYHPDLVVTFGVNQTSAGLGLYAERRNVSTVLWLQSNADLQQELYESDQFIDRYGVRGSHAKSCLARCRNVICQTGSQMDALRFIDERYFSAQRALHSICIPNPVATNLFYPSSGDDGLRHGILWVGRADRFHKRPMLAIEIARRCPSIRFLMILNASDEMVAHEVKRSKPPNVELVDYVPSMEMPSLMRKAWLFLSTGSAEYEGFPNVLLEAAASGTPIVSLEDFDGFLGREKCGLSGDVSQVAAHIERLRDNPVEWEHLSQLGMKCVRDKHQLNSAVEAFRGFSVASTKNC